MTNPDSDILPLRAAYVFGAQHGLETEMNEIRNMDFKEHTYSSSLRRAFVLSLLESKGLFEEFKQQAWPVGNTEKGQTKCRWYARLKSEYEATLAMPHGAAPLVTPDSSESSKRLEFALEAHLRDFLARNLDQIEPGLKLHKTESGLGVEYIIDGGRIDLLAVDRNGKFVVVELKLSNGRNKALGQLLYYMGWVDDNLGNGPCRGVIVASEISDELRTAVARAPGVAVAEYRMTFSIQ